MTRRLEAWLTKYRHGESRSASMGKSRSKLRRGNSAITGKLDEQAVRGPSPMFSRVSSRARRNDRGSFGRHGSFDIENRCLRFSRERTGIIDFGAHPAGIFNGEVPMRSVDQREADNKRKLYPLSCHVMSIIMLYWCIGENGSELTSRHRPCFWLEQPASSFGPYHPLLDHVSIDVERFDL